MHFGADNKLVPADARGLRWNMHCHMEFEGCLRDYSCKQVVSDYGNNGAIHDYDDDRWYLHTKGIGV